MSVYFIDMPGDEGKKYHKFPYPAGEIQVRLLAHQISTVETASKIVVTATITDGNPMPLLLMLDALAACACSSNIILMLPYLPYSRADRRFAPGDCAGLKTLADCLTYTANQIITFDVHSPIAIGLMGLKNVGAETIILNVLNQLLPDMPTILLPDKGSLTRYNLGTTGFAGYGVAHCEKQRAPETGLLSGFVVPKINTHSAIIIDDICDGGATFLGIAKEIGKTQPDIKLYLYVSHGIFSKGFDELRQNFVNIFTTDSFPSKYIDPNFVRTIPIGGILKGSVLSTEEIYEQTK